MFKNHEETLNLKHTLQEASAPTDVPHFYLLIFSELPEAVSLASTLQTPFQLHHRSFKYSKKFQQNEDLPFCNTKCHSSHIFKNLVIRLWSPCWAPLDSRVILDSAEGSFAQGSPRNPTTRNDWREVSVLLTLLPPALWNTSCCLSLLSNLMQELFYMNSCILWHFQPVRTSEIVHRKWPSQWIEKK